MQTQELAQKEVSDETLLKCVDEDPVVKPKKVVSHNNTSSTKNEKSGDTSNSLGSCHVCGKDNIPPLALSYESCKSVIHYECSKLPKYELAKYVRNRAKKYMCASCCEKDNKLSNIMNSLPTENCDYNDVLYLVKSELEKFKSTTLSSLESRFISAIEKCNKNEYLDEIIDMCSKMLKLTESHNNVIKNLKMQTEHTDLEKDEKIKDLEIENAVLRQYKGTVKIGDEEMRRKVESLTKERNELQDSNDALRKREQELLLASQKRIMRKLVLKRIINTNYALKHRSLRLILLA